MSVRTERCKKGECLSEQKGVRRENVLEKRKKKEATNFNRMKFRDIIVYLSQGYYYILLYVYT